MQFRRTWGASCRNVQSHGWAFGDDYIHACTKTATFTCTTRIDTLQRCGLWASAKTGRIHLCQGKGCSWRCAAARGFSGGAVGALACKRPGCGDLPHTLQPPSTLLEPGGRCQTFKHLFGVHCLPLCESPKVFESGGLLQCILLRIRPAYLLLVVSIRSEDTVVDFLGRQAEAHLRVVRRRV